MKEKRNYIMLVLRGIAMGAADVIPGVSGGTIAFITGIYEELINSIRSLDVGFIKKLAHLDFKGAWNHINGNFLFSVLAGIAISIFSLASLMQYLLETHPIFVWSFFFGLIIASAFMVAKEVKKWNWVAFLWASIGVVVSYYITVISPASTPNDWWFILLCGAVAICAMILPGISGAFILLLMGKYAYIIGAVSNFDLAILAVFAVGAIAGIISFSHLLSWLLKNYHSATVAMLIGFMVGSLNKIWPWKQVLTTYTDSHGVALPLTEQNILPSTFEQLNGVPSNLWWAVACAAAGLLLIFGIEKLAVVLKKDKVEL